MTILKDQTTSLQIINEKLEQEQQEQQEEEPIQLTLVPITEPESLGTFRISHYCLEDYPHTCNNGDPSITASGLPPIPYASVSTGSNIPLHTKILINEQVYTVLDRGGKITDNCIDIAVPTHEEALNLGVYDAEVYLYK